MTPAIVEELWEYSTLKGSALLLILAIARHANHDGTGAYPSLATLKRLTRLSHSQVCLLLRQLADEGHLIVTHGTGPGGTNVYTIMRTWDTQAHPKIGHAKIAHARARPKFGPNQEPERKTESCAISRYANFGPPACSSRHPRRGELVAYYGTGPRRRLRPGPPGCPSAGTSRQRAPQTPWRGPLHAGQTL